MMSAPPLATSRFDTLIRPPNRRPPNRRPWHRPEDVSVQRPTLWLLTAVELSSVAHFSQLQRLNPSLIATGAAARRSTPRLMFVLVFHGRLRGAPIAAHGYAESGATGTATPSPEHYHMPI
jgi:hypothetical protein